MCDQVKAHSPWCLSAARARAHCSQVAWRVAQAPVATLVMVCFLALAGCSSTSPTVTGPEVTSFLGTPLGPPTLSPEFVASQEEHLTTARAQIAADPSNVDARIWLGRRQAYLARYRQAIESYSIAIDEFPNEPRLYRHRGHRWLTLRKLDRAIQDFDQAESLMLTAPDRIEPDGLPNAKGIPTSTLYTNVYYHLGLAHYLKRDFRAARRAYSAGLTASKNPDMRSAMSYWLLLTLWRLDEQEAATALLATIDPSWPLIENEHYHGMLRAFAGDAPPMDCWRAAKEEGGVALATVGYGVGAWLEYQDQPAEGLQLWKEVVGAGTWNAFGAIASEAELAHAKQGRIRDQHPGVDDAHPAH